MGNVPVLSSRWPCSLLHWKILFGVLGNSENVLTLRDKAQIMGVLRASNFLVSIVSQVAGSIPVFWSSVTGANKFSSFSFFLQSKIPSQDESLSFLIRSFLLLLIYVCFMRHIILEFIGSCNPCNHIRVFPGTWSRNVGNDSQTGKGVAVCMCS